MDKVSYALGLGIGRQLADMGANKLNIDDFDNIKYLKINDVNKGLKPIHLISDSMESLILPIRASKEMKNEIINDFNNFKKEIEI